MLSRSWVAYRKYLLPVAFAVSPAAAGCAWASGLTWPWSAPQHTAAQPAIEAGVFPPITAQALDNTMINLPGGLEGRRNLLLLAWDRDQAAQVDTWTAVAQALQHTQPDFRVYRMLVSAPENILFRWWDDASLRAAESDPDLLHSDIPLYTDEVRLRRSLGLPVGSRAVVALLVERSGAILWMATGASAEATRASLLAAARAGQ